MAVEHHTYVIKTPGRPQGAGSYGDADAVKNLIAATQPGKVTTAAGAFDDLGTALNDLQTALYDAAKVLADHWSGPAADNAQETLRRLYTTAEEVVIRSNESAKTLQWYGGSILPMYRNVKWPKNTKSPTATAAADQVMKNLNERIAQTWDGMPPQIKKDLPRLADPSDRIPDQPGAGSPTARATGREQTGGGGTPSLNSKHHAGHPSHSHGSGPLPGKPGNHGGDPPSAPSSGLDPGSTDLAGSPPVVGSPGPIAGASGDGLGRGVLGPGGGPFSQSTSTGEFGFGHSGPGGPVGSGLKPGLTPLGGAGVIGARPGAAQARGVYGGERLNGTQMPLASGSERSRDRARERTTWLSEDPDVWVGDEVTFGGLIGDARNRLDERERSDDEVLSLDELQDLLDLVDEETGENTGALFSEESDVDPAANASPWIVDE